MCRLFALHAGDRDVDAQFWLLDAPDSLARQSESNADGYGLAAITARQGMILHHCPGPLITVPERLPPGS